MQEEEKITRDCIELSQKISVLKIENITIKSKIKQENFEYEELESEYKRIAEETNILLSNIAYLRKENEKSNELVNKLKNSDYIKKLESYIEKLEKKIDEH